MASRDPLGDQRIQEALAAGQSAFEESRFEQAANHFRVALRITPRTAEQEAIIRAHLSHALEKRGMNHEQLEVIARYDNFADFARLTEPTQMTVLIRLGWGHSLNNDIPRAIALFNQAMRIARHLDDDAGIGACYFGLGRAYRYVSEIRIARDQYASALECFRQVGGWRELAESYFNIASIDFREGDHRSALHMINQALTIIGDRQEHELLGRAYNDLALLYDNIDLPTTRALAAWEKCIEHFRSAGRPLHLAINYNNLAYRLINLGDWGRAEELLQSAIDLLHQTSRVPHLASTYDTLAQLKLVQGKVGEADALLGRSLEAFLSLKAKGPLNRDNPVESSTHTTIGRSHLLKGEADLAISAFERSIDIAVRLGDRQYVTEARIWLIEALLAANQVEDARQALAEVRGYLREAPDMLAWGPLMRMVAKIEAHDDSIEAAIHSLGQSTSIFEIRGSVYERAVNRIVAAQILHKRGDSHGAAREVRAGLEVFDRLGATIDSEKARALLSELSQTSQSTPEVGPNPFTGPVVDGFVAQRLVSASISRELLLHELAAIARNYTDARAAFIAQAHKSDEDAASEVFEIGESVGLSDREQSEELRFLEALPPSQYRSSLVFPFSDDQEWHYLLHLVEPKMRGVLEGRVSLDPLVSLAEQGLERHTLRSRTRRTKPFNPARLLAEVELPGFICASRAMSRVLEQIHKIRSSDVTVLITGESGTGKELVARAIHAGSTRRLNVFVPFNCSAAPREMIESQLFGFRKGAFTGAVASNTGIIRAAEGGTIFLDEIGDLPIDLQPKLLRFLQEGEVQPIGDNQPSHVDVRVLAATNSDLEKAVAEGRFREDLFHRLNVIRLLVPPLRERREEIPAILNHYLKLYQHESSKSEIQLSEETVDLIVVYDWPGNVRQLCNEVRRIVAYADSRTMVTPEALSPEITRPDPLRVQFAAAGQRPAPVSIISQAAGITLGAAVEELERRMIAGALERSSGNIARAAKELGLSRKGLYLKMDRLNFKS